MTVGGARGLRGVSSGSRVLARRSAHGRGAVGAGALPHGDPAGQLQLQVLEERHPDDLRRLGTLPRTPGQHGVHHVQLRRDNTTASVFHPHNFKKKKDDISMTQS